MMCGKAFIPPNYVHVNIAFFYGLFVHFVTLSCTLKNTCGVRRDLHEQHLSSWCLLNSRGGPYITFFHKGKLLPSFHPVSHSWINLLTTAANLLLQGHSRKMVFGMVTIIFCSGERFNADGLCGELFRSRMLTRIQTLSFYIDSQFQLPKHTFMWGAVIFIYRILIFTGNSFRM